VWKHLTHPNIVPLLGVTFAPPQLISEWMSGGDLRDYINKNPEANRLGLVGTPPFSCLSRVYPLYQLFDITKGLCYLHSCNVVHGCLKGVLGSSSFSFATILTPGQPDILVDATGHARITDFGLATIIRNLDSAGGASDPRGYTPRWAAPEVLNGGTCGKEGDIFSFAMVMVEVRQG
jgi:serine/threonine protein kinase